jgi:hypothetical protein
MILVKSTLFGVLSLIWVEILLLTTTFTRSIESSQGTAAVVSYVSFAISSPLIWILAVLTFALGFQWKYRRLKLRQAR